MKTDSDERPSQTNTTSYHKLKCSSKAGYVPLAKHAGRKKLAKRDAATAAVPYDPSYTLAVAGCNPSCVNTEARLPAAAAAVVRHANAQQHRAHNTRQETTKLRSDTGLHESCVPTYADSPQGALCRLRLSGSA
jgi:hypothetical protein